MDSDSWHDLFILFHWHEQYRLSPHIWSLYIFPLFIFLPAKAQTLPAHDAFRPQSVHTPTATTATAPSAKTSLETQSTRRDGETLQDHPGSSSAGTLKVLLAPTQHHHPQVHSRTRLLSSHAQILVQPCSMRNLLAQSLCHRLRKHKCALTQQLKMQGLKKPRLFLKG